MSQKEKIVTLKVNGREVKFLAAANRTLLEALRLQGFVEVKCGCETGDCGACAILLDGTVVDSCLTLVWHADGREVTTIKGIGRHGEAHAIQRAFIETGAAQCGYCTPGMVIAAKALLKHSPNPSLAEIKRGLSGNLCRCTGYTRIFEAIQLAAKELRTDGEAP